MRLAAIRKLTTSHRAHEVGLLGWDIAKMVTILGHYLNGFGVVLIIRFRHQRTHDPTKVAVNARAIVDACNLQDSEIIIDAEITAITTRFRERTVICFIQNGLICFIIAHNFRLNQHLGQSHLLINIGEQFAIDHFCGQLSLGIFVTLCLFRHMNYQYDNTDK